MSEMQKILDLIESVDPEDTGTLNEIDARVTCLVKNWCFLDYPHKTRDGQEHNHLVTAKSEEYPEGFKQYLNYYTRSRDALKSIRPEGWWFSIEGINDNLVDGSFVTGVYCEIVDYFSDRLESPPLPTEELAELHAVVQAIEWSRQNDA